MLKFPDEELGLEASQGGEEVASIGDVSLEKIGEDLSDEGDYNNEKNGLLLWQIIAYLYQKSAFKGEIILKLTT